MTDRVYPSSKPKTTTTKTTTTATTTATTTPTQRLPPPPNKTQPHTPTTTTNRHRHHTPTTTHHRRRRRGRHCFCLCCFWSTLTITLLLLIATVAACILYLLYHPHRPSFSIAALKTTDFRLTTAADDTTKLTSKLNLTISTKNPNKKLTFYYDSITITCSSHDTLIAKGSYPNPLISNPNNITIIHSSLHTNSMLLDTEAVNKITSDLKKKSGIPLTIVLDTEARVKIESIRSMKVGIRIKCEGIHSLIPKGNGKNSSSSSSSSVAANVSAAKCKIDLRIKIWKWTF